MKEEVGRSNCEQEGKEGEDEGVSTSSLEGSKDEGEKTSRDDQHRVRSMEDVGIVKKERIPTRPCAIAK